MQVEKTPKPMPACATPALEGMVVHTDSAAAQKAQQSVMEFLLINHPLDCPICDQGGECQLQDLAVGYGGSRSRYNEEKRVVFEKNLGPLISTDMTRCIHCTRCVRFGREIAGIMELGLAGRGEHSEIMPFVERTVESELSGNMIDVCPVGALTSKPFRYTARPWELTKKIAVAAHDSWGSNIMLHEKNGVIKRIVPAENEEINECWISDRDRFSYLGLHTPDRALSPYITFGGRKKISESIWSEAISASIGGLRLVLEKHGAGKSVFWPRLNLPPKNYFCYESSPTVWVAKILTLVCGNVIFRPPMIWLILAPTLPPSKISGTSLSSAHSRRENCRFWRIT